MSKIIVLDPGHGGGDPGALDATGTRFESHDNLRLGLRVRELLQTQQLAVMMTRATDEYLSLAGRAGLANSCGADLFVSLHRNSFGNTTANGTEIWVYTTAGAVDEAAAGAVLEELVQVGVQSNRGVKKGNYHVLRETKMTSMLVELGFISNSIDNRLFDEGFEDYAGAIARGICRALGVPYTENGQPQPAAPQYKVQVGAFSVEENARAFLEQVRGMGLEAFLVVQEAVTREE